MHRNPKSLFGVPHVGNASREWLEPLIGVLVIVGHPHSARKLNLAGLATARIETTDTVIPNMLSCALE